MKCCGRCVEFSGKLPCRAMIVSPDSLLYLLNELWSTDGQRSARSGAVCDRAMFPPPFQCVRDKLTGNAEGLQGVIDGKKCLNPHHMIIIGTLKNFF